MTFPVHYGSTEIKRLWDSGGEFEVMQGFIYCPAPETSVLVGKGWTTDLASIPRVFQSIFSKVGKHDRAAIIHDWLYMTGKLQHKGKEVWISRKIADGIFLQALQYFGVKKKYAYPMYWAVRLGGGALWNRRNHPEAQLKSLKLS